MSAKDIADESLASHRPEEGADGPPLLGRKSVLLGMLTSGFVATNVAQATNASAGTVKPVSIAAPTPVAVMRWTPDSAYSAGTQVISPNNDVVCANVANTSSSTYATDAAKWTLSSTFAAKPSASDRIFIVSPRGSDANDGLTGPSAKATIGGALTAAAGSACTLLLAAGNHALSAGVSLPDGTVIRGAGQGLTTINYTGAGTAFTSAKPGVRTFYWEMSGFLLSGPSKTGATVGIDLDSVSMAHLQDLRVTGFGKGVRIRSVVSGGAVYNRIAYSTLISCGIGLSIESDGSNATTVEGCRLCACITGVKIVNSNDNSLKSCQIETNTVGVHIEATSAALADYNAMDHCRFETNTLDWETTIYVRDTVISFPHKFGNYRFSDLGQRTVQLNGWAPMATSTRNIIGAASFGVGGTVFDTTLGKPIWSNGTVWKDSAGTTV